MELAVLGPLEVRRGAATVTLGSRRQRQLLAALIADAGRVVPVDALVEALWGDDPPSDPRNAIQTYVARLREALGPGAPIATRAPGYCLEVDASQVDALRFEELLAEAQRRRGEPRVVVELLDEALGLWRGPAYAELADDVARGEALRLAERRLVAVEERAAACLALGAAGDLVGELESAAVAEPLRERLVELRMQALARLGRQREALEVYRVYREALAEETGLEPSAAVRELEGRILRGELDPPPGGPGASRVATPAPAASLVGRDAEIAEVRALLERARLVTLTGPGGVGKTRVAAEVVRGLEAGGEEAGWVELAPVGDPAAVEHVLAAALGIDLAAGAQPERVLLTALADRRAVLVLDNCEHLIERVAPLVEQLGRRCPSLRVLATSRERLAVDGERVQPIAPLPIADEAGDADGGDAVRLFLERAQAAGASVHPGEDRAAVAAICRELDGLPLAIELAAARAGAVALDDLLAGLRADPAVLGRRRGQVGRHRDLWSVADWSYRLLERDEQRLFEGLGVFAGAFGVDEAHAVCAPPGQSRAATAGQVAVLAERCLLAPADLRSGRYRLLRPLRAFARQRLADRDQLDALAQRHAKAFAARAEQAAGPPLSDDGRRWLEGALDDLREVRQRAQRCADAGLLARLVACLYRFDYWRPGSELMGWGADALLIEGIEREPAAPQVHAAAGAAAWQRGDLDAARRLADRAVALGTESEPAALAIAYDVCGDVANFEGRLAAAEAAFRQEARLSRLCADPDGEVLGLASAALVVAYAGGAGAASAEADAAAAAAGRAGPAVRAFARYAQGECRAETAPVEALELVEDAARLAGACEAAFVEGVARLTAASLRGRHGEPAEALPAFADLLRRWRRSGSWTQQWTTLRNLAELLVTAGADEAAVAIAAAVGAERAAAPTFGPESDRLAAALERAASRLGGAAFRAAQERGARMAASETVDLALGAIGEVTARPGP